MAFLVVLDSMTPAEGVAVILHDVFRYSFADVAQDHRPYPGGMPPAQPAAASAPRRLP